MSRRLFGSTAFTHPLYQTEILNSPPISGTVFKKYLVQDCTLALPIILKLMVSLNVPSRHSNICCALVSSTLEITGISTLSCVNSFIITVIIPALTWLRMKPYMVGPAILSLARTKLGTIVTWDHITFKRLLRKSPLFEGT